MFFRVFGSISCSLPLDMLESRYINFQGRRSDMPLHPFAPVLDPHCTLLILGSFPSVRSRETKFYYGHPRNRFWTVLSTLFCESLPSTIEEKTTFLLRHGIALWDIAASCDIRGSSDASMHNIVPNDLRPVLESAPIHAIVTNGQKAHALYRNTQYPILGIDDLCLPSTSPANASYSLEHLTESWKAILPYTRSSLD